MSKSCCESLFRSIKNWFSSSSNKKNYIDLSETNPETNYINSKNKNKKRFDISDNDNNNKQKFNFHKFQEIFNLFNLNVEFSNKLSETKDYGDYKITISIKSKSSLEIENQNALFNISLDIEYGKFKKKFSPVILDAIYNYINQMKSLEQIKEEIKLFKKKLGDLIINGKISINYTEKTVIFILDIKHPDEYFESSDILEIKIEFVNPNIKNAINIGKKIYNKFPNKKNLTEKDVIIAFLIIVLIMIIYYKINNSEEFLYELNKIIENKELIIKTDNFTNDSSLYNYN